MTLNERLKEIEGRLEKATPGPWDSPARKGDCYVAMGEMSAEKAGHEPHPVGYCTMCNALSELSQAVDGDPEKKGG